MVFRMSSTKGSMPFHDCHHLKGEVLSCCGPCGGDL